LRLRIITVAEPEVSLPASDLPNEIIGQPLLSLEISFPVSLY
jgi:hypothetical protein